MTRTAGAPKKTTSRLLPPVLVTFCHKILDKTGGYILLATAVFLLVSLWTYNPQDPSMNTATETAVIPTNFFGTSGAFFSDLFIQAFGIGSYALVGILASWGWRKRKHEILSQLSARFLALFTGTLCFAVGLAGLPALGDEKPWTYPGGTAGRIILDLIYDLSNQNLDIWFLSLGFGLIGLTLLCYAAKIPVKDIIHGLTMLKEKGQRVSSLSLDVTAKMTKLLPAPKGNSALTDAEFRHPQLRFTETTTAEPLRQEPSFSSVFRASHTETEEEEDVAIITPAPNDPPETEEKTGFFQRAKSPISAKEHIQRFKEKRRAQKQQETQASQHFSPESDFILPDIEFLDPVPKSGKNAVDKETLQERAKMLESVLNDFGVKGAIVNVRPGPVVTLYELEPAPGTKSSRVINLADDIARSMSAISVRVAVVPGRNVIGIELPNEDREFVYFRDLMEHPTIQNAKGKLDLILGKGIGGEPVIADLAKMPHLLIAGTTGSGKSVGVNAMILSLLYKHSPEKCRFIMIDPKMLELSIYDGIPHLLSPVVTDPRKAVVALKWTVREMEERYRNMSKLGVRNIEGYNARLNEARATGEILTRRIQTGFDPDTGKPTFEEQPMDLSELPYIVVIIDEMADLMLVAGKEIEAAVQRLAQMARAAGIHIITATQRPSVDVITGTIKANFPTRISFMVTSKIDSRTILGEPGAEQLLGQGDMLHMAGGGRIKRVHGPFVSDEEVEAVVSFLKSQGTPSYVEAVTEDDEEGEGGDSSGATDAQKSGDEMYDRAVELVCRERKASTSFIQRHLAIGYNRAARIVDQMEAEGIITKADHVGRRQVLARNIEEDIVMENM